MPQYSQADLDALAALAETPQQALAIQIAGGRAPDGNRGPAGFWESLGNAFSGGAPAPTPAPAPAKKSAVRIVGKQKAPVPVPSAMPAPSPSPTPVPEPTNVEIPGVGEVPTSYGDSKLAGYTRSLMAPVDLPPPEQFDPLIQYTGEHPLPGMQGLSKTIMDMQATRDKISNKELPPDLRALASLIDSYSGTQSLKGYQPMTEEDRMGQLQKIDEAIAKEQTGLSKEEQDLLQNMLGLKYIQQAGKIVYAAPKEGAGTSKYTQNFAKFRNDYKSSIKNEEMQLRDLQDLAQNSYLTADGKVNPVFQAGFPVRMARIMGEKGALSERDVAPYRNITPDVRSAINRAWDKASRGQRLLQDDVTALRDYISIRQDQMRTGRGKWNDVFIKLAKPYGISEEDARNGMITYGSATGTSEPMTPPPKVKGGPAKPKTLSEKIEARKKAMGLK